jgi:hypothetical protein
MVGAAASTTSLTDIYHVYSDASKRQAVAIAVRVVLNGAVVGEGSAKTNCKDNVAGEIMGHCEALAMTPVRSKCILFHDLDSLPQLLDFADSLRNTAKKYGKELARLRTLILEREVALKRAYGPHYHFCHINSRRAAGKKLRPIGRMPTHPDAGKPTSMIGASKEEIADWAKRLVAWRERKKL